MNICVFCSSSESIGPRLLELGYEFGRALARRGHGLIYGGYTHGLMGRVARGVFEAGGTVTGVVPQIFDDEKFIFSGCARLLKTGGLRERKAVMQAESDAFAILPGGVGTYDEFFDTLALLSTGQLDKPIAVLDHENFFAPLAHLLADGVEKGVISKPLVAKVPFCGTIEALLDTLERA